MIRFVFNCFNSFGFKVFEILTCFLPWSLIVSICFSKAFPKAEQLSLTFSIICFWLDGNISSPVRYSYLSILPDDMADIFAAS